MATQYQIRPDQAYATGRDVARAQRFLESRVLTANTGRQTSKVERIISEISGMATDKFSPQALTIFQTGYRDYLADHPVRRPKQSQ